MSRLNSQQKSIILSQIALGYTEERKERSALFENCFWYVFYKGNDVGRVLEEDFQQRPQIVDSCYPNLYITENMHFARDVIRWTEDNNLVYFSMIDKVQLAINFALQDNGIEWCLDFILKKITNVTDEFVGKMVK